MLLLKSQEVYKTLFLQDRRCKCRIFYLILCLVYFGLTYYQYYYIRINFSIILFVFYLLYLSFVPFILLSSLLLDQLYFILYFIFILYTCFCFINSLVFCQWIKTCMLYSYNQQWIFSHFKYDGGYKPLIFITIWPLLLLWPYFYHWYQGIYFHFSILNIIPELQRISSIYCILLTN